MKIDLKGGKTNIVAVRYRKSLCFMFNPQSIKKVECPDVVLWQLIYFVGQAV